MAGQMVQWSNGVIAKVISKEQSAGSSTLVERIECSERLTRNGTTSWFVVIDS